MLTSQNVNPVNTGLCGRRMRPAAGTVVLIVALAGICACSSAFIRQDGAEGQADCQKNLKQYTLGLLMYCQDYDERFPPMKFPAQVEPRVFPYVRSRSAFSCPVTATKYLPNPALNYLTLSQVAAPAKMMVLRDAKPHTTGSDKLAWNVTYVDGAVKLVTTEPTLGKPAPTPPPLTHAQQVRGELQMLRLQRREMDARIHQLEREQQRLHSKR